MSSPATASGVAIAGTRIGARCLQRSQRRRRGSVADTGDADKPECAHIGEFPQEIIEEKPHTIGARENQPVVATEPVKDLVAHGTG